MQRYSIHREKDFEGTAAIEIGPGRYSGQHWQPGFVFIDEDDFAVAESAIHQNFPGYDHFEMNDIPAHAGRAIIKDWRTAAKAISTSNMPVFRVLWPNSYDSLKDYYEGLEPDRKLIVKMLEDLADLCERFVNDQSGFCVLGI